MERVRFGDALGSVGSWTAAECVRMVEACKRRIAEDNASKGNIVALLQGQEGLIGLDDRLTEEQLGAELDAAMAEFDRGEGYSADEMLIRVRSEFGW